MFGDIGKIMSMMKNLQGMKENMEKIKEEMAGCEYTASSSDNGVQAVVTGDLTLKRLIIRPDFVGAGNAGILQDAVLEAVNSALSSAKLDAAGRLSEVTRGMDLPGIS